MLPRVLSFAIPLFVYTALVLVGWGIYRERRKIDRWAIILALTAFVASMAFRPNEHLLFFDEDIYIQIASNLSHAPVAQLTLAGGQGDIHASTYYKEPAGFPALLSLIFLLTGTHEFVAFVFARLLYAVAVGVVYLLGREILKTREQALTAAIAFAATPACFAFSASTGTDVTAALFAALVMWGVASGNEVLAVGGMAMLAQVRLEMLILLPLVLVAPEISRKWKAILLAMIVPEVIHVFWVFSIASSLMKVEHVTSTFSPAYVLKNVGSNLKYLFDPRLFPIAAAILCVAAFRRRSKFTFMLAAWPAILFGVYALFYAGSFDINPRYSIQLTIPIVLLAASAFEHRTVLITIALTALVPALQPWQLPGYVQALAFDHRTAVEFAQRLGPADLVIAGDPEIFVNQGKQAINAVFATEQPRRLPDEIGKYKRVFYYGGIRTNEIGSEQEEADRKVKSAAELHLVDAQGIYGYRIAVYELLNLLHGDAR